PLDPSKNVAGVALNALLVAYKKNIGFEVFIKKHIKPGSGLGSSAASAAGVVVAANYLLDNFFSKEDLVRFGMCGEELASGVKHADNIAPCIYGSITLIRSLDPLDIVPLISPPMYITVVHPQIEVKTSYAREILPKQILLKDAILQWANIAGLVAGLLKSDYELIGRSLEDIIIEPVRSVLIPGFSELKARCKEVGVLGGGISGSGPSVFFMAKERNIAQEMETIMIDTYNKLGIDYKTYVTSINSKGIEIM
ncbi:MAG: homoserine kinase, partial [Ferruginibacter sp.]